MGDVHNAIRKSETFESLMELYLNAIEDNRQLGVQITTLTRENAELRKSKNVAYDERNQLVAYLADCYPSSVEQHPEADTDWEDDWRTVIYIDSPMGQLSWHVHDSQRPYFDHVPRLRGRFWDGHTTEEKYRRLRDIYTDTPTKTED